VILAPFLQKIVALLAIMALLSMAVASYASVILVEKKMEELEQIVIDEKSGFKKIGSEQLTIGLCKENILIVDFLQIETAKEKCTDTRGMLFINVPRVDSFQSGNNVYLSSDISENVEYAKHFGGRVGVVFSEDIEKGSLTGKTNNVRVANYKEALRAIGYLYRHSDAIVIGGNPKVFTDEFWDIAGRLAIKYEITMIGGSKHFLKKGVAAGVYPVIPNTLNGVIEAIKNRKIKNEIIINRRLMEFLGW